MKKTITLLTFILLAIFSKAQTTIAPDTINANTTWQDTVFLNTNCYIQNGVKLTINAGAKIIAYGNYAIQVQGSLQAIGSEQDSILFTIADTTGFTNLSVIYGGWGGIELLNTDVNNDSTILYYCILQYGKANGLTNDEKIGGVLNVNNFNKIRISNSLIQHNLARNQGAGLLFKDSSPLISNNIFNDNYVFGDSGEGGALCILGNSSAIINFNIFKYNKAGVKANWGVYIYDGLGAAICLSSDINSDNINVKNNRFYNNECLNGIFYESTIHTLFVNNVLANNQGAVIYCGHSLSQSKYINNTIINNDCYNQFVVINLSSESCIFYNNIVVGYTDDSHFSQPLLKINGQTTPSLMDDIKYNYFQYGNDYLVGEGNIVGGVPSLMFINPSTYVGFDEDAETYNYASQNSAMSVNKGILDTADLNLPDYDIIGTQRIFGGRIDMGAYENKTVIYNSITKQENKNINVKISPNPTRGKIQIELENVQENLVAIVLNSLGQEIFRKEYINTNNFDINIKEKPGLYFIKLLSDKKSVIKKVIKQ